MGGSPLCFPDLIGALPTHRFAPIAVRWIMLSELIKRFCYGAFRTGLIRVVHERVYNVVSI